MSNIGNTNCELILPDVELKDLKEIERSIQTTYRKEIWTPFVRALTTFSMINAGDKGAVAISGGKDSLILAKLLQELKRISISNFQLVFITMKPGFNDVNISNLKKNLEHLNKTCEIYDSNIFEIKKMIDKKNKCYK